MKVKEQKMTVIELLRELDYDQIVKLIDTETGKIIEEGKAMDLELWKLGKYFYTCQVKALKSLSTLTNEVKPLPISVDINAYSHINTDFDIMLMEI